MSKTPEERLLDALFGGPIKEEPTEVCAGCGKGVKNPVYLNGQPYHPRCLGGKVSE